MMNRRFFLQSTAGALAAGSIVTPAQAAGAPKPRLCVKGELLHDLAFNDLESDGWKKGRGLWSVDKAAAIGAKTDPEPLYFASVFRSLTLPENFILEAEYKVEGSVTSWLSFRGGGAFVIKRERISFHEDQAELKSEGVPFAKAQLKEGKWHPLIIERAGAVMAAEMDGLELGTTHDPLSGKIESLHFVVASDPEFPKHNGSLRGLKIYAATLNPKWKLPKSRR
jgi:hypothetical protein